MSDSGAMLVDSSVSGAQDVDFVAVMPIVKQLAILKSILTPGKVLKLTQFFTYTVSAATSWKYTFRWMNTSLFTYAADTIAASTPKAGKIIAYIYNDAASPSATPQIRVMVQASFQGGTVDVSSTSAVSVPNADGSSADPMMALQISDAVSGPTDAQITWRDTIWEMADNIGHLIVDPLPDALDATNQGSWTTNVGRTGNWISTPD